MTITQKKMRDLVGTLKYMETRCIYDAGGLTYAQQNRVQEIVDVLHEAVQSTTQTTEDDMISRKALLDLAYWHGDRYTMDNPNPEGVAAVDVSDIEAIKAQPTAQELPHGHWVWNPNGMDWGLGSWVCSECHERPATFWDTQKSINPMQYSGSRFCAQCGAKMEAGAAE